MNSKTDLNRMIHKLQQGKGEYLTDYAKEMSYTAFHLSAVRYAMNYLTFRENVLEAEGNEILTSLPEHVTRLSNAVIELTDVLIQQLSKENVKPEDTLAFLRRVADLREISMEHMRQVTNLTDRFTIYEYVLNREEYNYREGSLPAGYSDEAFSERLLSYIVGDRDSQENDLQMLRTQAVLEQLPIRMTKKKFFTLLRDGLSVYENSEKGSLMNLLDMIRTSAMISDISPSAEAYPYLYDLIEGIERDGFVISSKEEYDAFSEVLKDGCTCLNTSADRLMELQELINDLYCMGDCLCRNPEILQANAFKEATGIIEAVQEAFAGNDLPVLDHIYSLYENLEGVQERLYEKLTLCESVFDEMCDVYRDQMQENRDFYDCLRRVTLLISDSLYAELDADEASTKDPADAGFIEENYERLILEFEDLFSKIDRSMKKAVMAKVLTLLPPFIRNYTSLETYVKTSISGCEDAAEKIACVEILEGMMLDD